MSNQAELGERLQDLLAGVIEDRGAVVEGLARLSGGASRETWSFDLRESGGSVRPLILRRDPPAAPKGGMGLEAALLSAAAGAGVPVPGLLASSDDASVLGSSFMVVDRLEGETIPRRVLREPELAAAREDLARQCGGVLAALHSIPPDEVAGLPTGDPVEQYRRTLAGLGLPSPVFEVAFRWLDDHRPAGEPADAIVHGDFRNGNLIVGPDGIRAVLDWELAHRGDPMEDLGWLCAKSWRFGVDLPVGGFGTYDQLIEGYEAAGGRPVDRQALLWWEVFGNLRWGIICMMQASAHTSGLIRSVELAAIGRRVCEVEWDLLLLLAPEEAGVGASGVGASGGAAPDAVAAAGDPQAAPAAPGVPGGYLHGSPDAAGLVEAVREFIERDVMAATEGRVRFHSRVAVNVLNMVERELRMGPAQTTRHAEGLAALSVDDENGLAAAVREGRVSGDQPELWAVLRNTVRARLEVANPRYLDGPSAPSSEDGS